MRLLDPHRLAFISFGVFLTILTSQDCGKKSQTSSNPTGGAVADSSATASTVARPINTSAMIYGITIDDANEAGAIKPSIEKISESTKRIITTRIVIDPEQKLDEDYVESVRQLSEVGYVMALVADSHDMHKFNKEGKYAKRIRDCISKLGGLVDIWEIGNEVNGEWAGWRVKDDEHATQEWEKADETERAERRQLVFNRVREAYDTLKPTGKPMAVTFYYNDDRRGHHCWPKPEDLRDGAKYEMLTWIREHFTDQYRTMRDDLKYVFISFYEDTECRNLLTGNNEEDSKAFADVLNTLAGTFRNASVGFGEFGPECKYAEGCNYEVKGKKPNRSCGKCMADQREFISRYYETYHSGIRPRVPKFIGGYFYWYFLQDMVPVNKCDPADDDCPLKKLINALNRMGAEIK